MGREEGYYVSFCVLPRSGEVWEDKRVKKELEESVSLFGTVEYLKDRGNCKNIEELDSLARSFGGQMTYCERKKRGPGFTYEFRFDNEQDRSEFVDGARSQSFELTNVLYAYNDGWDFSVG